MTLSLPLFRSLFYVLLRKISSVQNENAAPFTQHLALPIVLHAHSIFSRNPVHSCPFSHPGLQYFEANLWDLL